MTFSSSARLSFNRRYLVVVALLALALYVLVPQIGSFHASWRLLHHLIFGWAAAALALTAATYFAAAATYCFLAFQPLGYRRTVLVELSAMFVNRLLPGGIGALGANYAYLRRQHGPTQAATVVGVNNGLGITGHWLIVAASLLAMPGRLPVLMNGRHHTAGRVIEIALGVLLALAVPAIYIGRSRFAELAADLRRQLFSYRRRPGHLAAALASSMLLTLSNVLSLWCCVLAVGGHASFIVVLLVFTFGVGAGTATPTPGGLGGFEAGLTAGFVAYRLPASTALAAALLYRFISYWLPLLAGAPALIISQKRRLFTG